MIQTDNKPVLNDSYGGTVEQNIPDDVVWYDDAFYVKKTRFFFGVIAQLVERLLCKQDVRSSSLLNSINNQKR